MSAIPTPLTQHLGRMFADARRTGADPGRCAAQFRRRCGMSHAVEVNIHAASLDVRVLSGFIHGEYRSKAHVSALQQITPFPPRLPGESSLKNFPLLRP